MVLADHDRRRTGHENEITLTVSDIIAHPEFEEYHNDIGGKKKSGWRGREHVSIQSRLKVLRVRV